MANYYFLAASLPPLVLGEKPELSFEELADLLRVNLKARDFEKTVLFRTSIDLNNIRFLLLEEAIDPRGNLSEKELNEALLFKDVLPEYVFDFLDRETTTLGKLKQFAAILARFFATGAEEAEGFLKSYFEFERSYRLVLLAIQAKRLGRDLVRELQFEDPFDALTASILVQKDAPSYEPPAEYLDLKEKFLSCGRDPKEQQRVLAKWRFDRLSEMSDRPLFTIDWILSYMAQLLLVEQVSELSEEKGKMIMEAFTG